MQSRQSMLAANSGTRPIQNGSTLLGLLNLFHILCTVANSLFFSYLIVILRTSPKVSPHRFKISRAA
jgi:hypothetical protein